MTDAGRHIAIEAHNLSMAYDKRPVLWDVDFRLPQGKIIGILGPNGSGKTTLLKGIMGLLEPVSGYIQIFGQPLGEVRHRVSYVPQRQSVDWDFPASVLDVCLMGRYRKGRLFKRLSKADHELAIESLEKVNMLEFKNRQIAELSGGQQQRVFLARALAQQADLYLMDEPFAGVDAASEKAILELLMEIRDRGKTVILVHHDLHTAGDYFDWGILLNTRLVAEGPLEEVMTQENIKDAYGGQLTILDQMAGIVSEKRFPLREKER